MKKCKKKIYFAEMALNLEGLSREEKKQALREKIARMEEEEADIELRDLLEWYSKLQKR